MKPNPLALSTNWNAHRHRDGQALTDEILSLGFSKIECGYRLTASQADAIRQRVQRRELTVCSVHAYCPTPAAAPGPEGFSLAAPHTRERTEAIRQVRITLELAQAVAAPALIVHAGRVNMRPITPRLQNLLRRGLRESRRYQWLFTRLLNRRERRAPAHFGALCRALDELLPDFEKAGIALCLENLPDWEALPNEAEMVALHRRYNAPNLRYWHDTGHGRLRDRLGFGSHRAWAERLAPICAGIHLHDNDGIRDQHRMPDEDSPVLSEALPLNLPQITTVLEPCPGTPAETVLDTVRLLERVWPKGTPT